MLMHGENMKINFVCWSHCWQPSAWPWRNRSTINQVCISEVLEKNGYTIGQNVRWFYVFRLKVFESGGGGGRVLYNSLVEVGRDHLEYLEVNATMLLQGILEIVQGSMEWIRLADNRDTCCAVVYTVAKFLFL